MPERESITCQSSKLILDFFRHDPNDFLSRLVTTDETWLYHCDPQTNNNQWIGGIAAHPTCPKNSECKHPLEKFSPASIFWYQDNILLIDCLPKGQTINVECYSFPLVQLKDILKEKRREKVTNGVFVPCTTMPRLTVHLQT